MKQLILIDCIGISPWGMFFSGFAGNLLSMASFIRENTDWEVRIIIPQMDFGCPLDEEGMKCIENRLVKTVRQETKNNRRTVFGFSAASSEEIIYSLPLAWKLKQIFHAPVIYGGIAPTVSHRVICEDYPDVVDAVIAGAGERVCVELLKKWDGTGPIPDISGVAKMVEGVFTFKPQPIQKIHSLPDRLHMDLLYNTGNYNMVIYNSAFDCPYNCRFCLEKYINPVKWSKPLDRVRKELGTLCQHMRDPLYILFSDPLFNFHDTRASGVMDICKDLGAGCFIQSRVDTIPFKALPVINKACRALFFGLEHINPDLLIHMNKTKKPQKYLEGIKDLFRITIENDITPIISIIINYPGTRRTDMEAIKRLIDEFLEDYYTRFTQGQGPHYLFLFPKYRIQANNFLEKDEIDEYSKAGVTWRTWFENPYKGFPVRKNLLQIIKNPSKDINDDEIRETIVEIQKQTGLYNVDFLKALEKRFPIFYYRLWLGGDYIKPCLDDENPHVVSMKKLVELTKND